MDSVLKMIDIIEEIVLSVASLVINGIASILMINDDKIDDRKLIKTKL